MLTVSLNQNKTEFTITSTNFTSTNTAVKLEFNKCSGTVETFTLAPEVTSYNITSSEPFVDNVYSFLLTITTSTGAKIVESKCYFIGTDLLCKSLDFYKDQDIEKTWMYLALANSNNCITCSCTDLCMLYTKLTTTACNDYSTNNGSANNQVCSGCC